jgi:hypothetical protein
VEARAGQPVPVRQPGVACRTAEGEGLTSPAATTVTAPARWSAITAAASSPVTRPPIARLRTVIVFTGFVSTTFVPSTVRRAIRRAAATEPAWGSHASRVVRLRPTEVATPRPRARCLGHSAPWATSVSTRGGSPVGLRLATPSATPSRELDVPRDKVVPR